MFTKDMTMLLQTTPEMKYWNAMICLHLPVDSPVPCPGVVFVKKKFIPRVRRQTDGSHFVWMSRLEWSRFMGVAFKIPDEKGQAELLAGLELFGERGTRGLNAAQNA